MNAKSVELLNNAIHDELSAIHQYMYFHVHCDDQGLNQLSNLFKWTAIAEMVHLEKLAERVLFLDGDIEMSPAAESMEQESCVDYNKWANECSTYNDAISKQVFESLAADEEKHYDQFGKE